jgi:transposase
MVNNAFVPNKKYLLERELEAEKEKKPGPVPTTLSTRQFYGATYLFDQIGIKLGINDDLRQCFPDFWKQLISIAYYIILEDKNPLSRFPRWAKNHRHPYGESIPSQRSSDLFGAITEDAKQKFFLLQVKRRLEEEYLAYDTTSVSSYSELIKQVRYGRNKDHEPLPQINLAILFGESSRLPVYYRKLAGNINDVAIVKQLIDDLSFLEIGKVKLVMDRGFYSEDNINALFEKHYKFLIGTKKSLQFVKVLLDDVRDSMKTRAYYSSEYKTNAYGKTIEWAYKVTKPRSGATETGTRRAYLHLYFDDQKAVDDKAVFNVLLDTLEEEIRTNRRTQEHETLYTKYYDISTTPIRGKVITPKQEAISAVEKNYGYFALMSNDIKDPEHVTNFV